MGNSILISEVLIFANSLKSNKWDNNVAYRLTPKPCFVQSSRKKAIDRGYRMIHDDTGILKRIPFGKVTSLWTITIFSGKTHYFYGHVQ